MVVRKNKYSDRTAGFTLLELLVVLTIAGLLVALVPPAVSAVVPGMKARVAALDLASTLREARYIAVSRSAAVDVEFDLEAGSYAIKGSAITNLPRGMALVIQERSGYVSETRRVAGHSNHEDRESYTLRFYPDGSSSGIYARVGPESGGGWVIVVDWLFGGASVTRAAGGEA